MPQKDPLRRSSTTSVPARRPWTAPRVDDMPRLTDLTLQTIQADCSDTDTSSCFG